MKTKDLGTYFVKVVFENGDGFILDWETGGRWTNGTDSWSPLTASFISPAWENEDEVIEAITYMFEDGNYSCDCNKKLFLDYAHQRKTKDYKCGDTLKIKTLTVITPKGKLLNNLL